MLKAFEILFYFAAAFIVNSLGYLSKEKSVSNPNHSWLYTIIYAKVKYTHSSDYFAVRSITTNLDHI
jgi:hypothetical protein